jgi:hypothetical protein
MNTFKTKMKIDEEGNTWIMLPRKEEEIRFKAKPNSQDIDVLIVKIKEAVKIGVLNGRLSSSEIADLINCNDKTKSTLTRIGFAMASIGYKRYRGSKGRYYIIE